MTMVFLGLLLHRVFMLCCVSECTVSEHEVAGKVIVGCREQT